MHVRITLSLHPKVLSVKTSAIVWTSFILINWGKLLNLINSDLDLFELCLGKDGLSISLKLYSHYNQQTNMNND